MAEAGGELRRRSRWASGSGWRTSESLQEYLTMETWLNDNVPVPGEVFREFVKDLYQRNLLVQNQMRVGRRVVDLRRITCPVLNLMAEQGRSGAAGAERALQRPGGLEGPGGDAAFGGPHRPGDGQEGPAGAVAGRPAAGWPNTRRTAIHGEAAVAGANRPHLRALRQWSLPEGEGISPSP